MNLPADANIALSLVNTKLRDEYPSLTDLCEEEGLEIAEVSARFAALGYYYDESLNKFIAK